MTQGEIFKLRPLDKKLSLDNCRRDEMQVGIPPMMELWLRLRKERDRAETEKHRRVPLRLLDARWRIIGSRIGEGARGGFRSSQDNSRD